MDTKRRPHQFPTPGPDGDVIAWKCRACGEWIDDGKPDTPCPVDWRNDDETATLMLRIKRLLPYSQAFTWICPLCMKPGKHYWTSLTPLVLSYEKHLRLIHEVYPEEAPL